MQRLQGTPLNIFLNGQLWVTVFFVLSGFVLPLRWFRTKEPQCIWGSMLRRYFRLMLPLSVCLSCYYLVAKTCWTPE